MCPEIEMFICGQTSATTHIYKINVFSKWGGEQRLPLPQCGSQKEQVYLSASYSIPSLSRMLWSVYTHVLQEIGGDHTVILQNLNLQS